jgi:hypothetical protein
LGTLVENGIDTFKKDPTVWLEKIYVFAQQALSNQNVKDYLIEKIETSTFVRDILGTLVENGIDTFKADPTKWLEKIYVFAQQALSNQNVKDYLIEKIETSTFIRDILGTLVENGIDTFKADPTKWLGKIYAFAQEAMSNPEVKGYLIAKIKESSFVKDVLSTLLKDGIDSLASDPGAVMDKIDGVISGVLEQHPGLLGEIIDAAVDSKFLKGMLDTLIAKGTTAIAKDPYALIDKAKEIFATMQTQNPKMTDSLISILKNSSFVKKLLTEFLGSATVKDAIIGMISDSELQKEVIAAVAPKLMPLLGTVTTPAIIPATVVRTGVTLFNTVIAFVIFTLPSLEMELPVYGQTIGIGPDTIYGHGICWSTAPGPVIFDNGELTFPSTSVNGHTITNSNCYWMPNIKLGSDGASNTTSINLASSEKILEILENHSEVTQGLNIISNCQSKLPSASGTYHVRPFVITKNAGRVYGPEVIITK